MLLTFLLVGRYLDQSMRRRTRAVAGNLAALKAETATKFVGADEISQVPVAAIHPGDIVLLRPVSVARSTALLSKADRDRPKASSRAKPSMRRRSTHRGVCRLAQHLRNIARPGFRGVGRHAAGGDHPAAGQCVAGPLPLCAPRRPGIPALCASGACDGVTDHARLGSDGGNLHDAIVTRWRF